MPAYGHKRDGKLNRVFFLNVIKFVIDNLRTYDSWFKIYKYSPWNVFSGPGLAEEGVEGVIATPNSLVTGHLTIWLDPVFETVQLPAGIADLDSGLADMDGDTFTLKITHLF